MSGKVLDVPVQINIWIRHDLFRMQFDVIKKVHPSILIVQSDGGRTEEEWESINRSRKIIEEEIDWDCRVIKIYMDSNQGMYKMLLHTRCIVWENVDDCIILEDDEIPCESFFYFCKEMLDKYRDDSRIYGICCFNPLGERKGLNEDYFFSEIFNVWGYATWKRADQLLLDFNLSFKDNQYVMSLLKKRLNPGVYRKVLECANTGYVDGHVPAFEFFYGLSRATQNALFIIPRLNLISNYGCGSDSAHSSSYKTLTRSEQKLFYSKTYELSFPLKHPNYVISDVWFQKKTRKLLGTRNPFKRIYRRIVKAIKILFFEGPKGLKNKIMRVKKTRKEQ